MRTFTDKLGRTWQFSIDAVAVKRLRDQDGVDLLEKLRTHNWRSPAWADPILFVDTAWALCQAQAKRAGVTRESFMSAMDGDAISAASWAFVEALADFLPRAQRKEMFLEIKKSKAVEAAEIKKALENG